MVFWKSHGFPCSCSELSYQVVSSSYFLTGKYLVFSEDQGAARKFSVAWGMLSYLKPNCYIYCKCAIKQTQLNTKSCSDLGILIVGSRNHKKAKKKKKILNTLSSYWPLLCQTNYIMKIIIVMAATMQCCVPSPCTS